MRLDDRNEPQPGETARPEAPVIRAWNDDDTNPGRWSWFDPQGNRTFIPYCTARQALQMLRKNYPGHTIDLSTEPPEQFNP